MPRQIIQSILDTDLYKLTMQQAVLYGKSMDIAYEEVDAGYEFINRGSNQFPPGFAYRVREQINLMSTLSLTENEHSWLSRNLRFLKRSYLDYLRGYRFDPSEVEVSQTGGELHVTVHGPWHRTILWEVPVMAIISELYFEVTGTDMDSEWENRIHEKAKFFNTNRIQFAEFGTRRRRSFLVQEKVVQIMDDECDYFIGTSNVYLAMQYGVKAIGTHAHEWFSAHAALFGYRLANYHALQAWVSEITPLLGIFFDAQATQHITIKHDAKTRQTGATPTIFSITKRFSA